MLTIIIPTINRCHFIDRQLNYLSLEKCRYPIIISDSSSPDNFAFTKELIAKYAGTLNITHLERPGLKESQCTYDMISKVTTEYLAFVPDDDFLIPSALEKCVCFLEKNTDYAIAFGKSVIVSLDREGAYGNLRSVGKYTLSPNEMNTPYERLHKHLSDYSNTNFGVHRTEQFKYAYKEVLNLSSVSFTELLPNTISSIIGKAKYFDTLYLVRTDHTKRYFCPDTFDLIQTKEWFESQKIFIDTSVSALIEIAGLSRDEAYYWTKTAFCAYMHTVLGLVSKKLSKQKMKTGISENGRNNTDFSVFKFLRSKMSLKFNLLRNIGFNIENMNNLRKVMNSCAKPDIYTV